MSLCTAEVAGAVGCSTITAARWADLLGIPRSVSGVERYWTEEQIRSLRVAHALQGSEKWGGPPGWGGPHARRSRSRILPAVRAAGDRPGSFLCLWPDTEPEFYPDLPSAAVAATRGGVCRLLRVPD